MTPAECGFKFGRDRYDVDRPSYREIADKIATVMNEWDIGSYQGDTVFLLADGDRRGLLIQGYGSCSGCDALQAVNTPAEAQDLIDDMVRNVHWEDSPGALARWIDARDWAGQWSWYVADARTCLRDVLCLLHGVEATEFKTLGYPKFLEPETDE